VRSSTAAHHRGEHAAPFACRLKPRPNGWACDREPLLVQAGSPLPHRFELTEAAQLFRTARS